MKHGKSIPGFPLNKEAVDDAREFFLCGEIERFNNRLKDQWLHGFPMNMTLDESRWVSDAIRLYKQAGWHMINEVHDGRVHITIMWNDDYLQSERFICSPSYQDIICPRRYIEHILKRNEGTIAQIRIGLEVCPKGEVFEVSADDIDSSRAQHEFNCLEELKTLLQRIGWETSIEVEVEDDVDVETRTLKIVA